MYQVFKESWLFHLQESNHIIQAFLYFLWPTFFAITLNTVCIVLQVFHALPVSSLHFLWKHSSSFYISPFSLDGFICWYCFLSAAHPLCQPPLKPTRSVEFPVSQLKKCNPAFSSALLKSIQTNLCNICIHFFLYRCSLQTLYLYYKQFLGLLRIFNQTKYWFIRRDLLELN